MHPMLFVYIGAAFLALRVLSNLYDNLASPTRSIPGPFLARFTRLFYVHAVYRGNFHKDNFALHQKYGPIVRVAPNLYSIAHPDKSVYGIGSKFPKSDWYEAWKHPDPERWALFPDRDIKRHAMTRRNFQAMYSMSSLVSYETYVDTCTNLFRKRLHEFAEQAVSFDMGHWFQCYAFDVIGEITYSQRFGFLDDGHDKQGIMRALHKSLQYSTLAGVYAWLHPFLFKLLQYMPNNGAAGRVELMAFVSERIRQRRQEREQAAANKPEKRPTTESGMPQDFLDKIWDAHEDNPDKVTQYHIFMMNMSNIIAGSDTTAISLSSVLYHLLKYPQTMARLRREVDEFGVESHDNVKFSEAQQMPYLQAVLKEALRMHAAVGLPLWRDVPQEGSEVSGRFFPPGSVVGFNAWVGHYDADVFGADVREFQPERWIETEKDGGERLQNMESYYSPFGFGARTCIGRHISILEMSKLIPQLIRCFDFELENADREWKTVDHWFVKPIDFRVRISVRTDE